jgi:hypothetical protein
MRLRLLRKTTLLPLRVRGREQPVRPSNPWLRGWSCPRRRRRSRKVKKEAKREPPMNRAHSILSVVRRLPNRVGQLTPLSANLHLFGFCYPKRAMQHRLHLRNVPSFPLLQRFLLSFHLHLLSPVQSPPHQSIFRHRLTFQPHPSVSQVAPFMTPTRRRFPTVRHWFGGVSLHCIRPRVRLTPEAAAPSWWLDSGFPVWGGGWGGRGGEEVGVSQYPESLADEPLPDFLLTFGESQGMEDWIQGMQMQR